MNEETKLTKFHPTWVRNRRVNLSMTIIWGLTTTLAFITYGWWSGWGSILVYFNGFMCLSFAAMTLLLPSPTTRVLAKDKERKALKS